MEYILILTLLVPERGLGGVAMETFATEEACRAAGESWHEDRTRAFRISGFVNYAEIMSNYKCVPKALKK